MRKTYDATKRFEIAAGPDTCYRVTCDFESYPEWFTYVRITEVEERDKEGDPARVRFTFDTALKRGMTVVMQFSRTTQPPALAFSAAGGDLDEAEGSFRFDPLPGGRTDARFRLKMSTGIFLPAKLMNYLFDRMIDRLLAMLKSESERAERLFFR